MIERNQIPVYSICWLNHAKGGTIKTYYEPESREELSSLCRQLYKQGKIFDVVGYTSNIYFLPNYNIDILISTKKVKSIEVFEDIIVVDCGASVKSLARDMVQEGIEGFDGLVDLPGTIGAAVYGNSSCYGCSINHLLISFDLLLPNGCIVTILPTDLKVGKRSSSLKRKDINGVILSVVLRKEKGDKDAIMKRAHEYHIRRLTTQPPPQNNLGSIYRDDQSLTIIGIAVKVLSFLYGFFISLFYDSGRTRIMKRTFMFTLIGARDLLPYVYSWNRYIWKDNDAHRLFWKYHKKHQLLYQNSDFEIEIKGKK